MCNHFPRWNMFFYRNGNTFKAIFVRSMLHHVCAQHDKDQE